MKFVSLSPRATGEAAKILSKEILKTKSLVVVGFVGELGAGKTTFIKSLIKGLGLKRKIVSPTFLIMKKFSLSGKRSVYHIDAYRVKPKDLLDLGIRGAMRSPNIVFIEWADRVKSILPKNTIWIKLEHGTKENERHITINRR
jgi:tRNA threonylcarbamoyladenosine biosynthesis protein TsaE